jgi:phage gp36-like protein
MAFLTIPELSSHLYGEVVSEISRADNDLPQAAIDAAIAEASSYLTAYDVTTLFAQEGAGRNAIILLYCKDIAVWHYIQLANPGVEMELRELRYNNAIRFLKDIQSGKANPSLPTVDPEEAGSGTGSNSSFLSYGSNPKRDNYY